MSEFFKSVKKLAPCYVQDMISYASIKLHFPHLDIHPSSRIYDPKTCRFGKGVFINHDARIGPECEIGDYTGVNEHCMLTTGVKVGKYCAIAGNVTMITEDHPIMMPAVSAFAYSGGDYNKAREFAPITIGNDVWIGRNATILKGLKIGGGGSDCSGRGRDKGRGRL